MKLEKLISMAKMFFNYFRISEAFASCSDSELCDCVRNNFVESILTLLQVLDAFREYANIPIYITSSYRSSLHNKNVNGSLTSQHLIGEALDFHCSYKMPHSTFVELFKEFTQKSALSRFLGQVIIYNNFIHIGLRTSSHSKLIFYDKRTSEKSN